MKKVAEVKLNEGEPQGQMKVTTAERKLGAREGAVRAPCTHCCALNEL